MQMIQKVCLASSTTDMGSLTEAIWCFSTRNQLPRKIPVTNVAERIPIDIRLNQNFNSLSQPSMTYVGSKFEFFLFLGSRIHDLCSLCCKL